jgi:ankyrin repeat protein
MSISITRRFRHLVLLAALASSNQAFCGEIHDAVREGNLLRVKALVEHNPDLVFSKNDSSIINPAGGTPLHIAAAWNQKDVAAFLLANHADVNAKDNEGITPLYWAVESGHDVVEELLLRGADVNAADQYGLTPLHEATRMGLTNLMKLLLTYKADVNAKENKRGSTPLHMAAAYGRTNEARLLIANHANVDAKGIDGRTPLHVAAWKAWPGVGEVLLTNHADVNAKDESGFTPLHLALDGWDGWDEDIDTRPKRAKEMAELLRRHGGHE